jgi:hypothetical protein
LSFALSSLRKKAAPLLGPHFKRSRLVGDCQERQWK